MPHDDTSLIGHICIYLPEGEAHIDMEVDTGATLTPEELASSYAESVHQIIIKFYEELSSHAQSSRLPLQ